MYRRCQYNTAARYPGFDIVVLSSRDFLFVRRSATTWKNEGEPVLLRTRGDKNTPYNETVFSDNRLLSVLVGTPHCVRNH